MNAFIAELIGTAILVVLGNGVVANVLLQKTKGHGSGWIVITFGWGMAVFVGVFCVKGFSGAQLNPAVTIALAAHHGIKWQQVPGFIGAQLIGAFIGALVVFLFYRNHFAATDDADAKLGCFCTSPAIRDYINAFFCEMVGTFLLVFPIFLMTDPSFALDMGASTKHQGMLGLGAIGALPVGLVVFAIGLSLGGTTGYAINPARDFAPRLAHFLLPIRNKRDSDWRYAWVPILGPIVGGLLAAAAANAIGLPMG